MSPNPIVPAWIQAGAAVASFLVTALLAFLTWRYVRVTRQIADASKQQVDQALAFARRDQVAVARTLLEETKRIRSELGPVPPGGGLAPLPQPGAVPHVHPWVHP